MQHPDEGTIHAWLDGELKGADATEFEAHVAACVECAAAVTEARGLLAGASRILLSLDGVPGGVVPRTAERAVTGSAATLPAAHAAPSGVDADAQTLRAARRRGAIAQAMTGSWIRIAASIALLAGTGLAVTRAAENMQQRTAVAETPGMQESIDAVARAPQGVGAEAGGSAGSGGSFAPDRALAVVEGIAEGENRIEPAPPAAPPPAATVPAQTVPTVSVAAGAAGAPAGSGRAVVNQITPAAPRPSPGADSLPGRARGVQLARTDSLNAAPPVALGAARVASAPARAEIGSATGAAGPTRQGVTGVAGDISAGVASFAAPPLLPGPQNPSLPLLSSRQAKAATIDSIAGCYALRLVDAPAGGGAGAAARRVREPVLPARVELQPGSSIMESANRRRESASAVLRGSWGLSAAGDSLRILWQDGQNTLVVRLAAEGDSLAGVAEWENGARARAVGTRVDCSG